MKLEQLESFFEEMYYSNDKNNKRKKSIKYNKKDLIDFFETNSEEEIEMLKLIISHTKFEFYEDGQIIKVKLIFEERSG